jgi:predicted ArsR family transcriptional regulator
VSDAGAPDDRFVTATEAAALLGVTARSVRRQIERLADADRDIVDTDVRNVRDARDDRNRPVRLVRLSALAVGGEAPARPVADADRGKTDVRVHDVRNVPDVRDTLIEQLQLRLADAQSDRDAWRAQAAALADRLKDADARLALVAASSGRLQIAPQEPDSAPGEESVDREGKGTSAGLREAAGAPVAASRSWWARLWRHS